MKRILAIDEFSHLPEEKKKVYKNTIKAILGSMYKTIKIVSVLNKNRSENKSKINNENIVEFLTKICYPFYQKNSPDYLEQILKKEFPLDLSKMIYDPQLVISKYSIRKMQKNLEKYEVIKLRHISNHATSLVIGCGHDWLDWPLITPYTDIVKEELIWRNEHLHENEVTVDIDFQRNPDIVAYFGQTLLHPLFKGKRFKEIVFEGFFPPEITLKACEDLRLLLDDGGKILLTSTPFGIQDLTEQFHNVFQGKADGIWKKSVERENWGQLEKMPVIAGDVAA